MGTGGSLCDINILSATFFFSPSFFTVECCLIPISEPPFPWEVQSRISGLIRGNLQMFVNTRAAAESGEDLPFKRSDVDCLSEVGFLGNHGRWARSLAQRIWSTASCMLLRVEFFFAYTRLPPLPPPPPPYPNSNAVDAFCLFRPSTSHLFLFSHSILAAPRFLPSGGQR